MVLALHADGDGPPPPGGRTLVLLHGFTGDGSTWQPLRGGLRRWGSTLAVDLVGHGRSPAPPELEHYRMEACLEQVLAVLRRLHVGAAWWVGYSMGGRVALQLAARHPECVQGLVLLSTTAGTDDPAARAQRIREDEALADSIEAQGVPAFIARWLERPMFAGLQGLAPEARERQRTQRLGNSALGLANSLRGMGSGAMEPVWQPLAGLRVPTLILCGAEDAKFVQAARRLHGQWPHARLREVAGAGHALHVTHAREVLAAVDEFFAAGAGAALAQASAQAQPGPLLP